MHCGIKNPYLDRATSLAIGRIASSNCYDVLRFMYYHFRVLLTGCSQPAVLLSFYDNRTEWLITFYGYIAEPRHTRVMIDANTSLTDMANAS